MRCVVLLCFLTVARAARDDDTRRLKRSDDMGVLQTLVEQQASLIQTQQAELTATKNQVNTLQNSLQVLQGSLQSLQDKLEAKTKTVAFSARIAGSHDSDIDGLPLGPHQTVVFDETITNVGQAYNARTGIFTAPVSGTYAFFLSQMSPNNHDDLSLAIIKNGATLDVVYAQGRNDVNDQGSSQVTAHLVAGDQVTRCGSARPMGKESEQATGPSSPATFFRQIKDKTDKDCPTTWLSV